MSKKKIKEKEMSLSYVISLLFKFLTCLILIKEEYLLKYYARFVIIHNFSPNRGRYLPINY